MVEHPLLMARALLCRLVSTLATARAKLEPFLGFMHSTQYSKPSIVCDLEELYRYLIDDFAFDYIQGLKPGDFMVKDVQASRSRKGKRDYLNDTKTRAYM